MKLAFPLEADLECNAYTLSLNVPIPSLLEMIEHPHEILRPAFHGSGVVFRQIFMYARCSYLFDRGLEAIAKN